MDLVKTGKFIAALRKAQNLTQEQLGEKLGVTNKTVSRWETGVYLPPAEALLEMSGLFSVSVNELLTGKRLSDSEYKQAAEDNLAQAVEASAFSRRDRIAFYKKKWLREHVAAMVFMGVVILAVCAAGLLMKKPTLAALAPLLAALAHGWRNNAMTAYVEGHVYGGARPMGKGEGPDDPAD